MAEKDMSDKICTDERPFAAESLLSERPRGAPVLLGKMALEVAAIVKNAGHLDHAIFAAAIEKPTPDWPPNAEVLRQSGDTNGAIHLARA